MLLPGILGVQEEMNAPQQVVAATSSGNHPVESTPMIPGRAVSEGAEGMTPPPASPSASTSQMVQLEHSPTTLPQVKVQTQLPPEGRELGDGTSAPTGSPKNQTMVSQTRSNCECDPEKQAQTCSKRQIQAATAQYNTSHHDLECGWLQ